MATYKIVYDREGCIGAASCTAVSENWELSDDGKATFHKEMITEEELAKEREAAESCPVQVIHIINTETGEQII
ncbi:MAG: ferredoxin [Patescibacteria group bacterium]